MAATALSELTRLHATTYTPPAMQHVAEQTPGGLTRRTPKRPAEPVADAADSPVTAARPRSADDVRGLLAGFRAGVERGRSDNGAVGAPAPDPGSSGRMPDDSAASDR